MLYNENKEGAKVEEKIKKLEEKVIILQNKVNRLEKAERKRQISKIKKTIDKKISKMISEENYDFELLLDKYSKYIEINEINKYENVRNIYKFKKEVLDLDKPYDGFYAIIVNDSDCNVEEIVKITSSK